ncbi:hypothetical protein FCM35_KLT13188 [Carex littledalei]|uniref:Protein ENHANCED DISEASE RESISTANCE 2 C-terminal domain-containing protein n=1 Tax=Carex littledalei TaxID=544730 RepID=A0A833V390_9POAL|nr:hypothetical protein FCM35_KLT13188 [Carex littledalei]
MGGCVSRQQACMGVRKKSSAAESGPRRLRRRRGSAMRRRIPSRASMETISEADVATGDDTTSIPVDSANYNINCNNNANAGSSGSLEEAFFDTISITDSDDEFHSVHGDSFSLNGFEADHAANVDQGQKRHKSGEQGKGNSVNSTDGTDSTIGDERGEEEEGGLMNNCGLLPNNCLPCLASTVAQPTDKKRPLSTMPSLKVSFKRKSGEGHNSSNTLLSSKTYLERPLGGSQVQLCPMEKKMLDSWSHVDPSIFRVRGANYMRDKKKDFAPNYAAFYPFGVDVYLSPQKVNHISRFVELPEMGPSSKFPPLLVVNVQVPLYPASLFQNENDGEGFNIVMYFKLSQSYSKELPSFFLENIRRLIEDDVEKVKSFPIEATVPFRERLKILGRVGNLDELPLSAAERKLMHAYNEKPVLSRPQHEFYLGENYFEIDLDMHRFSYISRKGFETFLDRLKLCVIDFGLTIQGSKPEELPEQILCCVRLNGIDYTNYQQLAVHDS